jgi:hypothetical protein
MPTVLTRSEREAELVAQGVTGAALGFLLDETTQERHLSRVACALWAAEDYYLDQCKLERNEMSSGAIAVMAAAILWAEVVGIGGRDDVEGLASQRHPAFDKCGKGRKHATDGAAWSAAILDAARSAAPQGAFRVNENGVPVFQVGDAQAWVDETIAPKPWVYSILREGLRRSVGIRTSRGYARNLGLSPGWHHDVPFIAPPESAAAWAKLVNEATP